LQQNTTSSTTRTRSTWINNHFILSIVVDLTGEMGNMLHHIAHGRGIQLMAHQEYGIQTNMILRLAGTVTKSQQTSKQLRQCFPTLRNMTFLEKQSTHGRSNNRNNNNNNHKGSDDDDDDDDVVLLEVRKSQQDAMIQELSLQSNLLYMPTGRNVTDVQQSLSYVHNLILQLQQAQIQVQQPPQQPQGEHDHHHHNNTTPTPTTTTTNTSSMAKFAFLFATSLQPPYNDDDATPNTTTPATTTTATTRSPIHISFPYLHAKSFVNRNFFDLFYDDFRQFFVFDYSACCAQLPDPDESVFVRILVCVCLCAGV
jgi:hypothetical protein